MDKTKIEKSIQWCLFGKIRNELHVGKSKFNAIACLIGEAQNNIYPDVAAGLQLILEDLFSVLETNIDLALQNAEAGKLGLPEIKSK